MIINPLTFLGPPPQQVVACSPCRHLWPLPGSTRCDLSSEVPGLAPVIKIISIPYPHQNGKIFMVCGDINGIYIYTYVYSSYNIYNLVAYPIFRHTQKSDGNRLPFPKVDPILSHGTTVVFSASLRDPTAISSA